MAIKIKKGMKVRRSKCATCVFRPECDGGIELSDSRRVEITNYLIGGNNQLCHHDDNETICRGGRDFQLQIWHCLGLIDKPTDTALRDAMKKNGLEPGSHI